MLRAVILALAVCSAAHCTSAVHQDSPRSDAVGTLPGPHVGAAPEHTPDAGTSSPGAPQGAQLEQAGRLAIAPTTAQPATHRIPAPRRSLYDAVLRLTLAERILGLASSLALCAFVGAALLSDDYIANVLRAVAHALNKNVLVLGLVFCVADRFGTDIPARMDAVAARRGVPPAAAAVVHAYLLLYWCGVALGAMMGAQAPLAGLRVPDDFSWHGVLDADDVRVFLTVLAVRYMLTVAERPAHRLAEEQNRHTD